MRITKYLKTIKFLYRSISNLVDIEEVKNIEEFYFQDLTNFYFACAPDMYINNTDSSKWPLIKKDMDKYGLKDKSKYINGDVVLVNLNETKNKLTFLDFLKLFQANQFTCWDQDVISYCFNDEMPNPFTIALNP